MFNWYGIIDNLANGNILKHQEISEMKYLDVITHLFYLGHKSVVDEIEYKFQENLRKNKKK